MKRSDPVVYLTGICFVLGVLIVAQLRSTSHATKVKLATDDQARVLTTLVDSNSGLRDEIAAIEAQLARLHPANSMERSAALAQELDRLLIVSGRVAASGPGVRVDIASQVAALDMQDLINELRNAGAEAIAVNRQRVIVRSVAAQREDGLVLDGRPLAPPYVLEAIGQPDTMDKALLRRGGLVALLEYAYPGLTITVTKADSLTLPAYQGTEEMAFSQLVP
jgi:uncharacterized protein YlxW (UPF0749 family)